MEGRKCRGCGITVDMGVALCQSCNAWPRPERALAAAPSVDWAEFDAVQAKMAKLEPKCVTCGHTIADGHPVECGWCRLHGERLLAKPEPVPPTDPGYFEGRMLVRMESSDGLGPAASEVEGVRAQLNAAYAKMPDLSQGLAAAGLTVTSDDPYAAERALAAAPPPAIVKDWGAFAVESVARGMGYKPPQPALPSVDALAWALFCTDAEVLRFLDQVGDAVAPVMPAGTDWGQVGDAVVARYERGQRLAWTRDEPDFARTRCMHLAERVLMALEDGEEPPR